VVLVEGVKLADKLVGPDQGGSLLALFLVSLALLFLLLFFFLLILFSLLVLFRLSRAFGLFFGRRGLVLLEALIELGKVSRDFLEESLLLEHPVAPFLEHLLFDVVAFDVDNLLL